MHGNGTEQDITRADARPPARLLDVTRLTSRAGRVLTGIDRVEAAWLDALLVEKTPLFGLARVAGAYVLLDRSGLSTLRDRLVGVAPWGPVHPLFRLARKLNPLQRRAQSDLWRAASARVPRAALTVLLGRLPAGFVYINLAHTNLTPRVLRAVRKRPGARVTVFLHDTIPLDFPQFQAEGVPARFRALLDTAAQADLLLCNSTVTADDLRRHIPAPPPIQVVPLGVTRTRPDPAALPPNLPPSRPYFLVTGTIEPRKNHVTLLSAWELLASRLPPAKMPVLVIAGSRGWRNTDVFERLDGSALRGTHILECEGLSDGALAALTEGARACLFPSLAEGYGLPAAEAAAAGRPLACSGLPVLREILGDYPVYLPARDVYCWAAYIERMIAPGSESVSTSARSGQYRPMTWQGHFKAALKLS